jgi:hypothetical protein
MEQNSNVVTDSDTQAAISDRFEVETNVTVEPEKVEPVKEDKPEPKPEPDSQTEPTEEPQESKTINPRTQARKAEKERLLRENAEYAERIRQQEAELAKYKQPAQPEGKQPKDLSKEPDILDYEDAIEYTRDLAKYEASQVFKQETSKLNQQKQIDSLAERVEVFRADKPDYDEKVNAMIRSQLITPDIEAAILASKMGEQLSYHLANFDGDLVALRGLPKELLPSAIKEIESFIQKGGEKQEKPRVTQAPPPITPPSSTGKTNRSISSYTQEEIENMPLTEYNKIFMKK